MLNIFGIVGPIDTPSELNNFGTLESGGLGSMLNLILNILIISAGIYTLFNFIFAGYAFLSAGGEPKKIEAAWSKIWQSVLGLMVAAGSLILAAVFGQLIFGDASYILSPVIPTPL